MRGQAKQLYSATEDTEKRIVGYRIEPLVIWETFKLDSLHRADRLPSLKREMVSQESGIKMMDMVTGATNVCEWFRASHWRTSGRPGENQGFITHDGDQTDLVKRLISRELTRKHIFPSVTNFTERLCVKLGRYVCILYPPLIAVMYAALFGNMPFIECVWECKICFVKM